MPRINVQGPWKVEASVLKELAPDLYILVVASPKLIPPEAVVPAANESRAVGAVTPMPIFPFPSTTSLVPHTRV